MDDKRTQEGIDLIQTIWYGVAIQIVNLAIQTYNLDPNEARALKDVYLRQNDYLVGLRDD
jgi:hypothetical protein